MSIERKTLKKEAKKIIREAKPSPILVALVILLIIAVLQVLSMSLNGDFAVMLAVYEAALAGEAVYPQAEGATGFGWVLMLALELMAMVLTVGFTLYCLRVSRRIKAGVGDMFDAFGLFFRAVCISFVPNLLVSAWCMIYILPVTYFVVSTGAVWLYAAGIPLLIPAVQASYAYRQAVYITLDNPHLNCFQCIALSKAAMQGHKWELFKLDLSFLGWQFLSVVPFLWLWVLPYMRITEAEYYSAVMADFATRRGMPHGPASEGGEAERSEDAE